MADALDTSVDESDDSPDSEDRRADTSVDESDDSPDSEDRRAAKIKLVRVLAFAIVPAAFVGFIAFGLFKTTAPEAKIGTHAPEFSLPVLGSNKTLSSADIAGKPVVVNFWASWCVPCREEAPTLERAWLKYKDQGVRFLGVNVQDSEQDAQAFVKEMGITFPSVRDTDLKLWTKFGVRGLPETFFIDRTGEFVAVGAGKELQNQGGTKILGAIDPALLNSQIEVLLERQRGTGSK